MDDGFTLFWHLIYGAIGLGFFMYGRRQRMAMPFISGVGLMVVPYFVANIWLLLLSGIILMALPYYIRS